MCIHLLWYKFNVFIYGRFVTRSEASGRTFINVWIGWGKKDWRSISKTNPKWSEWEGMLGAKVDILVMLIPYVRMKSISLLGVWVIEFGRQPISWIKKSSIPLCNLSHSMEYGLIPVLIEHLAKDWFASIMRMIAWFLVCKSCIKVLSHFMAFDRWQ